MGNKRAKVRKIRGVVIIHFREGIFFTRNQGIISPRKINIFVEGCRRCTYILIQMVTQITLRTCFFLQISKNSQLLYIYTNVSLTDRINYFLYTSAPISTLPSDISNMMNLTLILFFSPGQDPPPGRSLSPCAAQGARARSAITGMHDAGQVLYVQEVVTDLIQ